VCVLLCSFIIPNRHPTEYEHRSEQTRLEALNIKPLTVVQLELCQNIAMQSIAYIFKLYDKSVCLPYNKSKNIYIHLKVYIVKESFVVIIKGGVEGRGLGGML